MKSQSIIRYTCLILALASWLAPQATPRSLAAPGGVAITVTTGLDDDGTTCDSNSCTLRGAIVKSNGNGQTFNFIEFANTVNYVFVTTPLPTITAVGTTINGSYNSAFPRIYGANGGTFFINADYVTLVFLTIVNTTNGPDIEIDGGTHIAIGNNYLGTVAGATDCAYVSVNQGINGVLVKYNNAGTPSAPVANIYGNVISCHQQEGIYVGGATAAIGVDSSNNVHANLIGLTPDGRHAAGNGYTGITVIDWVYTARDNLIRGNVIAGNGREGIYVSGTENTQITGNVIGLSADPITATIPIPNGLAGIALFSTYTTTIGGSIFEINAIAGNTREGIYVNNSGHALIGSGNFVGGYLQRAGSRVTLVCPPGWGNGLDGILLDGTTTSALISPLAVGCNGGAGIATAGSAPNGGNFIAPSNVAYNGGLPIDRGYDGVTPVNYPAITSVSLNGITPTIAGTACANCQVYLYGAILNPAAGHGGGAQVGSTTANGAGAWSITASPSITNVVSSLTRVGFTAHVIDTNGNTFEMRPRPVVLLPLIRR